MFFLLSKILSFLLSPIVWIFALAIRAFIVKPEKKKRAIWQLIVVAFVFSNSFILCEFLRPWEEEGNADFSKPYDAAIVLSGFVSYDHGHGMAGFENSNDRFLHGMRLLQQDSIKKLVLSGGSASLVYPEMIESVIARNFALDLGLKRSEIITERLSKNTRQNALYTKALLTKMKMEDKRILLITSAYHMHRARACFEKVGLQVDCYPVDYRAGERRYHLDHLLVPNEGALALWGALLHEWMGCLVYKMQGYI